MNQRQSWKWDAEAAFKRIEAQELDVQRFRARCTRGVLGPVEIDPSCLPRRPGWTRAADPALYARHEVDKPHGRDYEALTKAALRKPVGYWEDAPRGMKFNQDIDFIEPNPPSKELREAYNQALKLFEAKIEAAVAVPTSPPPADGGQPLLSAGTKPHGKDVDTADDEFEPVGTKVQIGDRITARIDMGCADGIGAFTVAYINEHGVFGSDTNQRITLQDYMDAGKRRILKRPTKPRDDAECRKAMGI